MRSTSIAVALVLCALSTGCPKPTAKADDAGAATETVATSDAASAPASATAEPSATGAKPVVTAMKPASALDAGGDAGPTIADAGAVTDAGGGDAGAGPRAERIEAVQKLQARLEADKKFDAACTFLVPEDPKDGTVEITVNRKPGGKCGDGGAAEKYRVSTKKGVITKMDAGGKWRAY